MNSSENGLNKGSTDYRTKASSSDRVLNRIHRIIAKFSHYLVTKKLVSLDERSCQSAQRSLYQSIRNLEASLANKRRGLGAQHNGRFVSRLLGHRQSRATPLVAKIGTTVERRSLRELQSLLFKLKGQYWTLHKRYSQIYGFSSYAHRNGMCYQAAVRQQNAL